MIMLLVVILLLIITLIYLIDFTNITLVKANKQEGFSSATPTHYIFWTGGYDSTFRILEALLVEKAIVVPIYLSGIIDNNPNKTTRRRNNKQELDALRNITEKIYQTYPETRKKLKPLVIVPDVNLDKTIHDSMDILYRRGMVRRPVCQYGALAQVSLDMNHPIEMAVEREPHSSMMYRSIHKRVVDEGVNRRISDTVMKREPEFNIYRNFRFSTLHLSKKEMLEMAKRYGFSDLLKNTWSCWYPQGDKPCGRCIMCKERVI